MRGQPYLQHMNSTTFLPKSGLFSLLAATGFFMVQVISQAQSNPHLTIAQPGGMPGVPVMTGIERSSNSVVVTWDGPSGYYQLFQESSLGDSPWQSVGERTNFSRTATVAGTQSSAFFRVSGPAPKYTGASACAECHQSIHDSEVNTPHASALQTLQQIGMGANPECLPCHTVGFGLTTGYTNQTKTPYLAGVQCENCHGTAGNHAANPQDFTVKPRVELAAEVCGGCHTDSHHPTYDEWKTSGHAVVVEDMNPESRISSCGRCHSGSARLSLLLNQPLPVGDANVPITCAVCHDPHQTNAYPAQVRNPLYSTNDYFITTTDVFTNKYNPDVNLCAQCHNHRGASWKTTSRPPHHSPQYNMLLGTVGELNSGVAPNDPAAHAFLEQQCVTCHMQTKEYVSEEKPAVTGHSFAVASFDTCLSCHPLPEMLVDFTHEAISMRIEEVKQALDTWGTTKAPEAMRVKYGKIAWEYTTIGGLSSGGPGPSTAEQALIPDNIKKARFDLYLVLNDGSFGAHNGPYTSTLLDTAMNWVQTELSK
jgi:hypothetical protein